MSMRFARSAKHMADFACVIEFRDLGTTGHTKTHTRAHINERQEVPIPKKMYTMLRY